MGRAWSRQKFARFEILFKLPTATQPRWKHQASDESVIEDGSGLNLEIFDSAHSEIQQFLLKLLVTFWFHPSSNTKGDGTVDGLASLGEGCSAEVNPPPVKPNQIWFASQFSFPVKEGWEVQVGRGGWQGGSGRSMARRAGGMSRPHQAHSAVVAPHAYPVGLGNPVTVSGDTFPQTCKWASLQLKPSTPCSQHVLCFWIILKATFGCEDGSDQSVSEDLGPWWSCLTYPRYLSRRGHGFSLAFFLPLVCGLLVQAVDTHIQRNNRGP